jgi:hypothetical protein
MLDRMMDDRIIFLAGGALPREACSGVSMSAGSWYQHLDTGLSTLDSFLAKSWTAKSFFRGVARCRAIAVAASL